MLITGNEVISLGFPAMGQQVGHDEPIYVLLHLDAHDHTDLISVVGSTKTLNLLIL
uniref:Uncharacterized protein n=1 Tax=Triticum urartu TaxID=4572 RepID=A0A8R7QDB7_TRIUA